MEHDDRLSVAGPTRVLSGWASFASKCRATIRIDVRRHRHGDDPGADDLYASTVDADALIEAAPLAQHELRITRLLNDRKLGAGQVVADSGVGA